jgi:hypothetical protein
MNKLIKNPRSQNYMIKFRNYGIDAYAIFRGGEMIPIMRCIRCIERKEIG